MNTIFSFILVLGALIFVHELGHFLFAKLFKVRVLKFSLGFGPRLFGKTIGETEYVVSAFPLGGFVKMYGENPDEQSASAADKAASYCYKPVWQRFCIVFAGPLFNFIFPIFLFTIVFFFQGVPVSLDTTLIGKVVDSSPAQEAGLQTGDIILTIEGKAIEGWEDVLSGVQASDGKAIEMIVLRGKVEEQIMVTPRIDSATNLFGEEIEKRYMVGIMRGEALEYEEVNIFSAVWSGLQQTWFYIYLVFMGFVKLFQQVVPASEMGGPILIAQMAGEHMRAGWVNLIYFTSLLSVNLGILNLLPVPVLDGGHLVFLSIEALRRKPMEERFQIIAQQVGIALLGGLMIFVFYNDIVRLFS